MQLAIDAAEILQKDHGVISNIVSMPCLDKFLEQSEAYQSSVIKEDLAITCNRAFSSKFLV